jgi:ribosomal protein S18 acetylase RimI-like enzyme
MPDINLRGATVADHAAMVALWAACGLHPNVTDSMEGLAAKLTRDPELFLVAVDGAAIVGTVMGSYDGRRGWINRLAVDPAYRGHGIADRLMVEVVRRLVAIGCAKVNLLIEPDNAAVQAYYGRLGYTTKPLIFMEKMLK